MKKKPDKLLHQNRFMGIGITWFLFLLGVLQDFSMVEGRPLPGGGLAVLFAELVIDPDKVGEKESKKDCPNNYPEKIVISRRGPVNCLVVHFAPPHD